MNLGQVGGGRSLALLSVDSNTTTTGTAGTVYDIGDSTRLTAFLNVTAAGVGGSPTLDVYVQASDNGGITWYDIIAFAQVTTTALKRRFQLAPTSVSATALTPSGTALNHTSGALTANSHVNGPFGNLVRGVYTVTAGSTSGYVFTLHLVAK